MSLPNELTEGKKREETMGKKEYVAPAVKKFPPINVSTGITYYYYYYTYYYVT